MTTKLDRVIRPKVASLIEKNGKSAVLTHKANSSYNPATTTVTPGSTTTHAVKVVLADVNAYLANGSTVRATDRWAYLADYNLSVEPMEDDTLTMDGAIYKVVQAKSIYSGELVALWQLLVRK